jgi:hypothetical protein
VVADFEFLAEDPFAQRVKNAWDKGFLRAASISWLPMESAPAKSGRWRDTKSELLEWSLVAVPADPDALREAHSRMLHQFLTEPSANRALGGRSAAIERGAEVLGAARVGDSPGRDDWMEVREAVEELRVAVVG